MSLNSDVQESEARSKAIFGESKTNTQQVQTALQPVRTATSALEQAGTSQFNALANKGPGSPLRDALTAVQEKRDSELRALGEAGNRAAGLPPSSPGPAAAVPAIRALPDTHIAG